MGRAALRIGGTLGFVPLPWLYRPLLAIMLIAYATPSREGLLRDSWC
jgi:hypothetical protein